MRFLCILILLLTLTIDGKTLYQDPYWQILIHMSHNDKEKALQLLAALQSGKADATALYTTQQSPTIDDFFDHLFVTQVACNPQLLTKLGLFEALGITNHNEHLNDVSPQALRQKYASCKESLEQLKGFNPAELSTDQKYSYQVVTWLLEHEIAHEKFLFHEYVINQMSGILSELTALFTQFHTIATLENAHTYIKRLRKIPMQLQQTITTLSEQKERGIVPPRFTVEKIITMLNAMLPDDSTEHIFYSHLASRLDPMNAAGKPALLETAHTIIQQEVYPAYEELKNYFTNLLATSQTNHGVWALPEGDAFYAHMLKFHTTTNLSADEIHTLGLREVASIQAVMAAIFSTIGISTQDKSVGVLMQELSQDPQFYYPNTAAGRQECLTDYQTILERSRKELAHLFDLKPKMSVKIQQVPAHEELGKPMAYYFRPSMDGSRPGIFFANLRNMAEVPTYGMETLTIHEAEPGHHFQIALQQEMPLPIIRKITTYTAYAEGWALYTEKLAYEHGFYSSPYAQLGHLQDELLRAARLVIDTGIHHKRWSREQAIEYMKDVTGYHHDSAVTEVERYFVLPGQACAYKVGQLKILELRQRAKVALGDRFNIKEFHNVILKTATVPLTILESVIDEYIQKTKSAFFQYKSEI